MLECDYASRMVCPCGHHEVRLRGFFGEIYLESERITCFVDGFNLYHAILELKKPHLKWLDLGVFFSHLTRSKTQIIAQILYFSAYPTWKPEP